MRVAATGMKNTLGARSQPDSKLIHLPWRRMTAPLQLRLSVPDRFDKNEMPLDPEHGFFV